MNNDVTVANSSPFKYKSSISGNLAAAGSLKKCKSSCSTKLFKYFLEMLFINCRVHLESNWTKNCVMSNIAGEIAFKITNAKLYAAIINLSTKDNVNLTKKTNERFKRPAYWNEYKRKLESRNLNSQLPTRFCVDASFQGVKRLFVLAFDNTDNGASKVERNSIFSSKSQNNQLQYIN